MKKSFKFFGLITLICFSFFYTEKVMTVVSDQDPLKIEINNLKDSYKIEPNEAIVTEKTIIPGNNGREVNIEKSYKKMRSENVFNQNLLVYDTLYPKYVLSDNLDKYIIKGSINKKNVSIVFIINSNNNLNKIMNILSNKKVYANLFVDYIYLNNNISEMRNYNMHNIYPYEENYTHENLLIEANIIKKVSKNNPSYCLSIKENINNIKVCSYNDMNTIIPSLEGNLKNIKSNLENGSIILFDTGISTVNELSYIIDFIIGKGYQIVTLDKLLDENSF